MRMTVNLSVLALLVVLGLGYGGEVVNPGPEPNVALTTGLMGGKQGGKRTLVVLGDEWVKYSHSRFFKSLKKRKHELSFFVCTEGHNLELFEWNEAKYDNIVLFAPKCEVPVSDMLDFMQKGGNVLVATDSDPSDSMRKLLSVSGLELQTEKSKVVDSSNSIPEELIPGSASPRNAFYAHNITKNEYLHPNTGSDNLAIAYSGIGHTSNPENELVANVLKGDAGAVSEVPGGGVPSLFGSAIQLVSAVQARNNARMAFAGSMDMFSDAFFAINGASNAKLCVGLSKWVFAEIGVLRSSGVVHVHTDGSPADVLLHQKEREDLPVSLFPEPEMAKNSMVYRVKDDIRYSIKVEEYNEEKGGWIPFVPSDMQVELIMLTPYDRSFLKCDNTGLCSAVITAPDRLGIYKMRIMYRRLGLSVLQVSTQVSIRPFNPIEFERFIFSAYPYYLSIFSMMVGFFVFVFAFLHSGDDAQKRSRKSKAE